MYRPSILLIPHSPVLLSVLTRHLQVTVLMSARTNTPTQWRSASRAPSFRDGLLPYITAPSSFPPEVVLHHSSEFVWLRDKFPKSTVHTLLLPRDGERNTQHPVDAFDDAGFLASVRADAARLRSVVARELQRRFPLSSASGRVWGEEDVIVGVHARPSMRHVHVHVLSRDMCSPALKKPRHYNSFQTAFFIGLDEFPLAADDDRRPGRRHGDPWGTAPLVCWRCGSSFGRSFEALKKHLEVEKAAWVCRPAVETGRDGGSGDGDEAEETE